MTYNYRNYTNCCYMFRCKKHSTFTVQTVQLNFTYSSFIEAIARRSAAQHNANSPADVFWSAVLPAFWYCTCINTHTLIHAVSTDLAISRYSPKAQCHQFTALWNNPISSLWLLQAFWVLLHRNGLTFRKVTSSDHVSDEMITKIHTVYIQL